MFMTFDEIVNDLLLYQWSEKDKQVLKNTPEKDLIMYHHSVGRWIRNHYKLWDKNNPLTLKDYQPNIQNGVDYSERHPDAISMKIIVTAWKQLQ